MSGRQVALSGVLTLFVLGGYALGFRLLAVTPRRSLEVVVDRDRARVVSARPAAMFVDHVRVCAPPHCPAKALLTAVQPGLHQVSWQVAYLGQPQTSVAHSFVSSAGAPRPQLRMTFGQKIFDNAAEPNRSLARALEPLLRQAIERALEQLPWLGRTVVRLLVGAIDRVGLRITLRPQGIRLGARVTFALSEQRLTVRVSTDIGFRVEHGGLRLSRDRVEVGVDRSPDSSFWRRLRAHIGQHVLQAKVPEQVGRAVRALRPLVEKTLARVLRGELMLDIWQPSPFLRWRLHSVAFDPARAVHLLFDASVATKKGAVAVLPKAGLGRPLRAVSPCERVCIEAHADLLNAFLAHFHRERSFDRLAERGPSLFGRRLRELLSFRLEAARLRLAPLLWRDRGRWVLGIGRLHGKLARDDRRVPAFFEAHGQLEVRPRLAGEGRQIELLFVARPLAVSCGYGTWRSPLRPCFGAFVGMADRWLADNQPLRLGLSIVNRVKRSLPMAGAMLNVEGELRRLAFTDRGLRFEGSLGFSTPSPSL